MNIVYIQIKDYKLFYKFLKIFQKTFYRITLQVQYVIVLSKSQHYFKNKQR